MDSEHFQNTFQMRGGPDGAFVVFLAIAIALFILIVLLITFLLVLSYCKMFKKAGYSWAWGLIWLIPFGKIVLPLVLAFSDWPVLRELRKLKTPPPPASGIGKTIV